MPDYHQYAMQLIADLTREMYGVEQVVRLSLAALYTDGHVLLEGNPGLGKTALVKAFEHTLALQFGRIQFTPDLMPADITGTLMPLRADSSKLGFVHGPIFTSLLLADEINRATPKTQAAMLEAMAERQVTVLGETYSLTGGLLSFRDFKDESGAPISLADRRPFMVFATQNPIEHEGTYDLPEAQSDRFMFKVLMPTPAESTLLNILRKTTGELADKQVASADKHSTGNSATALQGRHDNTVMLYNELKRAIQAVQPLPSVQKHIANIFLAANGRTDQIASVDAKARATLVELAGQLQFGFGPRAAIALMNGAKAWSKLFVPDVALADGRALAQVALPVLRHRTHLTYEGRSAHLRPGLEPERVVDSFLQQLCIAAAPTTAPDADEKKGYRDYKEPFRSALDAIVAKREC